jgi:4-amino-4-deoxy-L-arabinose transferase-like glycosyltransferase
LWLIVAAAGIFRLGYVVLFKRGQPVLGDQIYYSAQAIRLARGGWFSHPFEEGVYAADHVPLTAISMVPVSWLPDPLLWQRMLMALYGTAVVAGIGLLAWRLLGRRTGLIAAAIATVYANLWMNDGLVMAETLAAGGVVAVLWCVYEVHRVPTVRHVVMLGVAIAFATLARAELLLLLPLVALPMVWWAGSNVPFAVRVRKSVVVTLVTLLVLAPWVGRNLMRFEDRTLLSTQDGLTLIGANCPDTYYGPGLGFWSLTCGMEVASDPALDQSQRSAVMRRQAREYISDHLDRVPVVVAARLGRGLSLWKPDGMTWLNMGEGRERMASRIGNVQFWLLAPLSVVGLAIWPSRRPRWPLVVTASLSVLTIAAVYGIPRFRIAAEVVIVIGAAVAVERFATHLAQRRAHGRVRAGGPRPIVRP